MKKILVGLVAATAVAAPIALTAAPAQAAAVNSKCATRAEFRKIHPGQTVHRTQSIIGSKGRVTMAGSWLSQRQWRVCNTPYSWVTLTYAYGRLDNKILL